MARYFTADLHLGHRNIIDYCGRPFRDVEQMDEVLVERWNATVTPEDEVIVLGDFAMGRIDETLPVAGPLNGTIGMSSIGPWTRELGSCTATSMNAGRCENG